ncbi:MAG: TonB family protein [Pseudomonadota bacterium]
MISAMRWSFAGLIAVGFHAALFFGFDAVRDGEESPPAGSLVSVSGSVASVLGSKTVQEVEKETPVREVSEPVLNEVEPVSLETVSSVTPRVAPLEVAEAVPPQPDRIEPVQQPTKLQRLTAIRAAPVVPVAAVETSKKPLKQETSTKKIMRIEETKPLQRLVALPPKPVKPERVLEPVKAVPKEPPRKKITETKSKPKKTVRKAKTPPKRQAARQGSNRDGQAGARAGGGGKSKARKGEMNAYARKVRARILSKKPGRVGEGRVVIAFRLTKSGGMSTARVVSSSGDKKVDSAAMRAVKRAAPFGKPPSGASSRQLSFTIPFSFR